MTGDVKKLVKLPPEQLLDLIGSYPGGSQDAYDFVKSGIDARRRDGASVWRDIEAETYWSTR
jgi:hypothetical protein